MSGSHGATLLVTGATGFVGRALALHLKGLGYAVKALVRRGDAGLTDAGIELVFAELGRPWSAEAVEAFRGVDTVFHCAAKVEMWGKREEFLAVNVEGTRSVIRACKDALVPRLVFTSSPSVIADGSSLRGVDESYPYPSHYEAFYPETKAIAEREVLAANGPDLHTAALRPHLIWGPGDTNLVPTIIERARAGRLMQIGAGNNLVDTCFIEDCVAAHVAAMESLRAGRAAGRSYFISQGEPVSLWGWINEILRRNGLPPLSKRLPGLAAVPLAWVLETAAKIIPGTPEPLLTRFLVHEMMTDHYFSIEAARRDLGFAPRFSISEAMEKTFGCKLGDGAP